MVGQPSTDNRHSVALLWRRGEPGELRYDDVSPAAGWLPGMIVGGVWLAATLLFLLIGDLVEPGQRAAGGRRIWDLPVRLDRRPW